MALKLVHFTQRLQDANLSEEEKNLVKNSSNNLLLVLDVHELSNFKVLYFSKKIRFIFHI
jgi:hypothetical protein